MAQNVGYLVYHEAEGDNASYYDGAFDLEAVNGKCFLVPNRRRTQNSPDWTIKMRKEVGPVEYGVAWTKEMQAGGEFLSITLDNPSMQRPIHVAAFPRDEQPGEGITHFDVQWSRAKRGSRAAPGPEVKERVEDEIPF